MPCNAAGLILQRKQNASTNVMSSPLLAVLPCIYTMSVSSGTTKMRCRNTLTPGKEQPISSGLHQRNEVSKGTGRFDKQVGKSDMPLMQHAILLFMRFFSGSVETERHTKVSGGEGDQIPWKCIPKQATCYHTFYCNNHPPCFLVPVEEMEEI